MKHVLIENGVVVQQSLTGGGAPEGFIEAPDSVYPGYIKTDSGWEAPQPTQLSEREQALRSLEQTDFKMPRPLEDLYDALLAKGTISEDDIAPQVRELRLSRKSLRGKL